MFLLARRLNRRMSGRTVRRSQFRVPQHATADLSGAEVLGTSTIGKHLLTRFRHPRDGELTLHTHLRMDGSWTVLGPGKRLPRNREPDVRVQLDLDDGSTAIGLSLPVIELVRTADEHDLVGHLGPDPLRKSFDRAEAIRRLGADPERPVIAALLDQTRMAGLGNLWVNELCFLRGVWPWTPAGSADLPAMVDLAVRLLRFSVSPQGAPQVTTGDTRPGQTHWVAGRAGEKCRRCGTVIEVVAEVPGDPERRRTWWCPHCQPAPAGMSGRP